MIGEEAPRGTMKGLVAALYIRVVPLLPHWRLSDGCIDMVGLDTLMVSLWFNSSYLLFPSREKTHNPKACPCDSIKCGCYNAKKVV